MTLPCLASTAVLLGALAAIGAAPAVALPPNPPSATKTRAALKKLPVAPAASVTGYARAKFGSGWTTTDGCDSRERALIRDGRDVTTGTGCRITGGRWRSIYDAKILTSPGKLDIDHIVPLAEAWRSGASGWTKTRRVRFANDLAGPQLIAVSASSNRSKGDSPPDEWKPPRKKVWCLYARWWTKTKATWKLTVTVAEVVALRSMLKTC